MTNELRALFVEGSVVRQQSLQERQRISQTVGVINVVPLKQSQVEILQQEQRHPSINVTINRPTGTKIALVDCFEKVWWVLELHVYKVLIIEKKSELNVKTREPFKNKVT